MHKLTLTLLIFNILHCCTARCPTAKFHFKNQTTSALYNFLQSSVGNIGSLETCPYTGRPYVYLPCYSNFTWGHEPYFSNCLPPPTTTTTTTTVPLMERSSDEFLNLSIKFDREELKDFHSSSDLVALVHFLSQMTRNTNQLKSFTQFKFHSLVDKLFSPGSSSWMRTAQKQNGTFVQLINTLEMFSRRFLVNGSDLSVNQNFYSISVFRQSKNHSEPIVGFAYDLLKDFVSPLTSIDDDFSHTIQMVIPEETIRDESHLVFNVFQSKNLFYDEDQDEIMSPVVSLLNNRAEQNTSVEIRFDLNDTNSSYFCASWLRFPNDSAKWLPEECRTIAQNEFHLTCRCTFLRPFALFRKTFTKPMIKFVEQTRSIVTLLILTFSSIVFALTIFTFGLFKKLRRHFSQRTLFLLSVNLLMLNIFFALIDLYRRDHLKDSVCIVVASFCHYFLLSTFSWILVLTLIQYLLFVKVFPQSIPAFTRKAAAFAQLFPLVPVGIVLIIDPWNATKRTDQLCWLSNLPFYIASILPIGCFLLVESILFSFVAYALCCDKTNQRLRRVQMAEPLHILRFSLAFSCFFGFTMSCVFGVLVLNSTNLLFQIAFACLIVTTGIIIFVLYLVTARAKRTDWNNTLKSLGMPSIYSPGSSSSSGFLTNREFSSSSNNDHHQKIPSRRLQFPSQSQHFIDAYMPSAPPPPAPPIQQPSLIIEGDDPLATSNTFTQQFYETSHLRATNINQPVTSLDDYSLFYSSNHDATKL